jgi:hypothetical protein
MASQRLLVAFWSRQTAFLMTPLMQPNPSEDPDQQSKQEKLISAF